MKYLIILTFTFLSTVGSAISLQEATNAQLLAELDRRLSGGQSAPGVRAIYSCDSTSRFFIELFSQDGSIQKKDIYVGNTDHCQTFAKDLAAHKSKILTMTLVAVCDSSARLYRYPLLANGTFGAVTDSYIGDTARCMEQAAAINTSSN